MKAKIPNKTGLLLALIPCFSASQTVLADSLLFSKNPSAVYLNEKPAAHHVKQKDLVNLVNQGQIHEAFTQAFELGDELFDTHFNALDGGGANVGDGQRFTRVPRADLTNAGEWANHFPKRMTGPNGQACTECHNIPFEDGSGFTNSNAHRDPKHTGNMRKFITRNTPHLFGIGGLQRLAEEMTEKLHSLRDAGERKACNKGREITVNLKAKGISFGSIAINGYKQGGSCISQIDTANLEGVDEDLVVKPLQWKGSDATVRGFNRDASHNELGMQAVEIVGKGVDGDHDGIVNEMTVGDQTALAIYVAAQPRPTSKLELNSLGLHPLTSNEISRIKKGEKLFNNSSCASCHKPSLKIHDPIFSEPSLNPFYRDSVFPSGMDPVQAGVSIDAPVTFDLTTDHPDNFITDQNGNTVHIGSFDTDANGKAIVRLYGDLKRHNLGKRVAENIDEKGTGRSVWITKELWGVGSTAPYLHDGSATTLTEAIIAHGGEAAAARNEFLAMSKADQKKMLEFLNNLVLFKDE